MSTPDRQSRFRPVHTRPRLHYVYFVLAGFDLLTVSLSLVLVFWITSRYEQSVQRSAFWADRLVQVWGLNRQATEVVAPANNVFDAEFDFEQERRDFQLASGHLTDALAALRRELDAARELRVFLDEAAAAEAAMVREAEAIFTDFRAAGEAVGARMAAMDRANYRFSEALGRLSERISDIQQQHLDDQAKAAAALRRLEFVIAGLIVLMVAGATFYGHRLARQIRTSAQELDRYRDHLETLVAERTSELESSYEQLRLAERLASIGTLAAGLGHDMNNLLFPIKCRLGALDPARLDEATRTEIDAVRRSIEYLQQLSDGLRQLALDPDNPDAAEGFTVLERWWPEVAPLLRAALPRGATLDADLGEQLVVAVAPHRLTQAVFNLVGNAGDVIGARGRVRVTAEPCEGGGWVRLAVADDGPGMTPEVKRRALDPFYTTKTRRLSTGLGLALVHGVAQACGGGMEIESESGEGTTVILTLPARGGGGGGAARETRQLRASVSLADRRTATFVSALLSSAGWEVVHGHGARNGEIRLWVVEGDRGTADAASRFLDGDPGRRIILFGAPPEPGGPWARTEVLVVRPEAGMAAMREAIAAVTGDSA